MASYWPPFQNPTEDAYCISFKYSQAVTRAPHHHTVGLNASGPCREGPEKGRLRGLGRPCLQPLGGRGGMD